MIGKLDVEETLWMILTRKRKVNRGDESVHDQLSGCYCKFGLGLL